MGMDTMRESRPSAFIGRLLLVILFTLVLVTAARVDAEGAVESRNVCGVLNRSLSVDPTGLTEGFSAVLYDNSNGLPTSEANAIAETGEGIIWIGSYAGLIRYDGNTFERVDSTTGITGTKCLYVDSQDRLWAGTNDNGVAVMDKGTIRIWNKQDGLRSNHVRALAEDRDGRIYVATISGIDVILPIGRVTHLEHEGVSGADMRDLRIAGDGTIYGATDQGHLVVIRDGQVVRFFGKEEISTGGACILPDPEEPDIIYQESADFYLCRLRMGETCEILEKIDISPLRYIRQMEFIDGKIWICAGNGIGVLDGEQFTQLENLPMNNNVARVMTDYLGNLWFTSTRQGVMKVVPNQFSSVFARFGLEETVVNSTCVYDGKLFAATDTGLIVLDEKGPVTSLPLTEAVTASGRKLEADDLITMLQGCRIRSIIRDSRGRMWISTWRAHGLLRLEKGVLTAFTEEDGLLTSSIRSVCEREDGTILVALTGGVNVIRDNEVIASYGAEDGIVNTESLCVAEGTDGDIILGSNGGGIAILGRDGTRILDVEDGLPSDTVMRLKRNREGSLIWIVASNAIAFMDADYHVTTVEKFPYPNNFDLYENSLGDMWVLSSNGIYVVPEKTMRANGEINPVFYGIASGLPIIATANSYSDLTPEGDLYIAGGTGVCKVNIEKSFENVSDLKAVVPYVEADGQIFYADENGIFTIPADTQKLTVLSDVYNYSLSNPQVSYQLEGFDRQSTTVNRDEMVPLDYTNLRGGTYQYVMQLKDSMGRGGKTVAVTIVKEKAFYEQIWFIVLAGVAILATVWGIVMFFARRKVLAAERKQKADHEQFEQVAEALASAIDAKDRYTNGHSRRVADYSLKIAREAGKSEEECEKVYFAALLHDVGKIGISGNILSKNGKLTDEEFGKIKQHPVMGSQILSSIRNSPWLSIGAHYHHERYNGRGYPDGLKGEEIPEIARIIAVADAYDAMTSNRSYRNAIPQHIVREELVEGVGTQFDPLFARIMTRLIDQDPDYRMQERSPEGDAAPVTSVRCSEIYKDCSEGFQITGKKTRIRLCSQPDEGVEESECLPSLIVFDSLDGGVHPGEENNRNILYSEYAQIRFDGRVQDRDIRLSRVRKLNQETDVEQWDFGEPLREQRYRIEAVRNRDHLDVKIFSETDVFEVILALPDASRYTYIAVTGENCEIHNIRREIDTEETDPLSIPRIAEEISFIRGCPVGDIPNLEVDGPRSATSEGIPIRDDMILTFHTMSLPTARLVWHCPYFCVFSSQNGQVNGERYREYMLLRLDGEGMESNGFAENSLQVERTEAFTSWNDWKEMNKQGLDCTLTIRKEKNRIFMDTENGGIAVHSVTTLRDNVREVFLALTGDQCALTNIQILRK